jgi:hypothetical protein
LLKTKEKADPSLRCGITSVGAFSVASQEIGGEIQTPILSGGDHGDAVEPENTEQSRQLVEITRSN